jgi:hypothetical protein
MTGPPGYCVELRLSSSSGRLDRLAWLGRCEQAWVRPEAAVAAQERPT